MTDQSIPRSQWNEFLQAFTRRHLDWPVTVRTHDIETGLERVSSRTLPLQSVQFDMEDEKNPRINVTTHSDDAVDREVRYILLRPTEMILQLVVGGKEKAVHIISASTVITIRLHLAPSAELVNGPA